MAIPTAAEVRKYLRGYCVDFESTFTVTGNTANGMAVISNVDTRNLEVGMRISGAGIPAGAQVLSIENIHQIGQFTLDVNATADGTDVQLTVTYYSETTDDWIAQRRDRFVVPYIERVIGQPINRVTEIEEYYSGNGGSILILNRRPVIEITNLTYTNIPAENQTGNLLLSVELIKEEGIVKSRSNFNEGSFDPIFSNGKNNIKITYTYGYEDTPDDICEAILLMTAKHLLIYIGARTGGGNITQSGYNRNYGNRGKYTDILNLIDQDIYSILRKYTTGVVGA